MPIPSKTIINNLMDIDASLMGRASVNNTEALLPHKLQIRSDLGDVVRHALQETGIWNGIGSPTMFQMVVEFVDSLPFEAVVHAAPVSAVLDGTCEGNTTLGGRFNFELLN